MPITRRLRLVLRRLLRAPLFTFATVLTLAVGIGANTAIFSVVYGIMLKPLPFPDSERLVGVWHTAPGLGVLQMNQGPSTYFTYREEGRVFEDIGLWDNATVSITGVGEPEQIEVLFVTDGTLPLLRVKPQLGRVFDKKDDAPNAPGTVILSHAYWQRKFGGRPDAVGQRLLVQGTPREIIGVLPASFRFLSYDPQAILPFRFNRAEVFIGNFSYQGVARLKPGVTVEQANADVARMIPYVADRFPLPPGFTRKMYDDVRIGPRVRPFSEDLYGDISRMLWVLFGTVGIVLLIACANVANLFLVRAEGRQQELAVRAALGASTGRIARELLVESLLLCVAGGLAGLALAWVAIRLLVVTAPEGLPRIHEIAIDPIVVLFAAGASLAAGVLFSVIPVARFTRPQLTAALKEGGRASSDGRDRHRMRSALVVAEIALALVLLVASALMMRTFQAMRQVDPGFTRPEEVLTLRISIPEMLIRDPEQTVRTHEAIAASLAKLPGVRSVGLSSSVTMDGRNSADPVFFEDFPNQTGSMPALRRYKWISEGYFETMGNHLVAGRPLTWADAYEHRPVVVISENLAREYWKDPRQALGRRIRNSPKAIWREIVGVAGDERDDGLSRPAPTIVYWPVLLKDFWEAELSPARTLAYAVRSARLGSPTFMEEIQQAVWAINPSLPLAAVQTLAEIQADSMAQTSFAMVMLAIAAAVALLLGIVGIYGVIAYIAAQRTREIGIRVALGAQQADVSGLFVRHGLALMAIGLVLGLAGAFGLTRLMASLLFGVNPTDPLTYAGVTVLLGTIVLLASYLPARQAARVDPVVALRADV